MTSHLAKLDIHRLLRECDIAAAQQFDIIDSTNDHAKRLATDASTPMPLLIVASRQTGGRGRGNNRWWTGDGALACTLLFDLDGFAIQPTAAGLLALAAGVAVAEAVAARIPGRRVGIRWPNDVFVEEAKIAGALIEVVAGRRCVLGIGLNTNNTAIEAPDDLRHRRVTTLRDETGRFTDPTDLLIDLLRRLFRQVRAIATDPTDVARRADALCMLRGHIVQIVDGRKTVTGRCLGINDDGGLNVQTPGGVHTCHAGVVHSPR